MMAAEELDGEEAVAVVRAVEGGGGGSGGRVGI